MPSVMSAAEPDTDKIAEHYPSAHPNINIVIFLRRVNLSWVNNIHHAEIDVIVSAARAHFLQYAVRRQ